MNRLKIYFLVGFISCSWILNAQQLSKEYLKETKGFLKDWSKSKEITLPLIALNYLDTVYGYSRVLESLVRAADSEKSDTFYLRAIDTFTSTAFLKYIDDTIDRVVLSPSENKKIVLDFKKNRNLCWENEFLDSFTFIADSFIFSTLSSSNIPYHYNNSPYTRLYEFSFPIFLRNYSICIFYYQYSCGNWCGLGKLALYKKNKKKWSRIGDYFVWQN
jgi:hypothetical protein